MAAPTSTASLDHMQVEVGGGHGVVGIFCARRRVFLGAALRLRCEAQQSEHVFFAARRRGGVCS